MENQQQNNNPTRDAINSLNALFFALGDPSKNRPNSLSGRLFWVFLYLIGFIVCLAIHSVIYETKFVILTGIYLTATPFLIYKTLKK